MPPKPRSSRARASGAAEATRPAAARGEDAWELLRGRSLAGAEGGAPALLRALDEDATRARLRIDPAWDGHRVLVAKVEADVRLRSADQREWAATFERVARALRELPARRLLLEGVLCALGPDGRPDFEALRAHAAGTPAPVVLVLWDALVIDDDELAARPLDARLEGLTQVLAGVGPKAGEVLAPSQSLSAPAAALRAGLAQTGLRGFVVRRRDAAYPGPSDPATLSCFATREGDAPPSWDRSLSPPPPLTNRDKVLYPADGLRKLDLVAYYDAIAPTLLPLMKDRPIVAQRWPDGIRDFTWYQHRPPPRAPDWLKWAAYEGDRRLLIQNRESLLFMVNQAALVFHGWSSRAVPRERITRPDWAILDLDPGEATTWATTVEVARAVHRLLELLELPSVLKTSGQKGLHVLIPLADGHNLEDAQRLALGIARMIERLMPDDVTLETERDKRRGRLYLDHVQGFVGKALVLPYSLRAADGAPVSTPIAWSELSATLEPRAFNLRTLRARLEAKGDLAAPLLGPGVSIEKALAKLAAT